MKVSREQWLTEGLKLLGQQGPDVLKIERLCQHLQVSKGSFYHHFRDREDYIEALLVHWQACSTEDVIASLASISTPEQRSQQLNEHIVQADLRAEIELRAWGRQNPHVAKAMAQVDQQRMNYVADLISAKTGNTEQARVMARIAYAHFVGCQYLQHSIRREDWAEMDQLLQDMVEHYLSKEQ
ncbi:MAG: TetR/AcrR family transcriptional regulator [Natronospirillum sp.]|uniref:TetR/AcrR family transcriptional regulator n=1 Tax=Natronospirillum sp. TaxID=2812955 RepID=UPI0025D43257|nr:TetR/AcrR family transcriptional regulator [Natronospirillum sp.]MCH8552277.1 TetR/AcrR family transcriptional regulator [Natronospirillum sp.]